MKKSRRDFLKSVARLPLFAPLVKKAVEDFDVSGCRVEDPPRGERIVFERTTLPNWHGGTYATSLSSTGFHHVMSASCSSDLPNWPGHGIYKQMTAGASG